MDFSYDLKKEFLKYFVSEVMSSSALEEAIHWIKKNLQPDDVFNNATLEEWAETKGYRKEEASDTNQ